MPAPFLTVNNLGASGQPQPRRILNATVSRDLGTAPATTFQAAGTGRNHNFNMMAQVGDRVFWWQWDELLSLNKATEAWSVHTSLPDTPLDATSVTGLSFWQDVATGEFGLVGQWRRTTAANFMIARYKYTTDTWDFPVIGAVGPAVATVMWRNQLVWWPLAGTTVSFYDPVAGTLSSIDAGPNGAQTSQNAALIVGDNKLFLVDLDEGEVFQLAGAFFVKIADLPNSANNATWNLGMGIALHHNGSLFCGYSSSAGDKLEFYEVNLTTFAVTDRSGDLPVILSTLGATGTDSDTWQFGVLRADQEDTLGSPRTFIYFVPGTANQVANVYEFVAGGTSWTDLGVSDFSGFMSFPQMRNGGGSTRFFTNGEVWGFVESFTSTVGGVVANLRFYGNGEEQPSLLAVGAGIAVDLSSVVPAPAIKTPIEPGSIAITYTSAAGGRTINDDGAGNLTGDVTGGATIDYATGVMTGSTSLVVDVGTNVLFGYKTNKTVRIRHDTGENVANTVSQLADPGALGPIGNNVTLSGNDMLNVLIDNGATLYKVKLELAAQGVPDGSRLRLFVEIQGP